MKTSKVINLLGIAFIALFISSCGVSTNVHVVTDKTANFHNYRSFAWLEDKKSTNTTPPIYNNDIVRNNVRFFATQELIKEGYVQNIESPDVYLELQVNAQPIKKVSRYTDYGYPGIGGQYILAGRRAIFVGGSMYGSPYTRITTERYDHSDVTINIIDKATNRLIGTISGFTDVDNPTDFNKHLQAEVVKIIHKSPLSRAS